MTKRALIPQAEMKRMAAIANDYDVCVEVETEGIILRIIPSNQLGGLRPKPTREEEAQAALEGWLAKRSP